LFKTKDLQLVQFRTKTQGIPRRNLKNTAVRLLKIILIFYFRLFQDLFKHLALLAEHSLKTANYTIPT